jgi:hypothetical protein
MWQDIDEGILPALYGATYSQDAKVQIVEFDAAEPLRRTAQCVSGW